MTLPQVTDMVPRIWYPLMGVRTGRDQNPDYRDQTIEDLLAIVGALPAAQRVIVAKVAVSNPEDITLDTVWRLIGALRALTDDERFQVFEGLNSPLSKELTGLRAAVPDLKSQLSAAVAERTTGGPLPATRLAPLTDRERSIVAAAEACREAERNGWHSENKEEVLGNLFDAVDLPKTPDVLAPGPHGDLPPELEHPANKMAREATRREEPRREEPRREEPRREEPRCPHGYPLCDFCDDPTNPSREQLQEKLRLATEQVEALKKCHDAASRCASIIRDLRVPSVALTNEMVNAFAEYENWLKPTGAK